MDTFNKLDSRPGDHQAKHRSHEMADHVESTMLLTIFPKEVWMLIFENVFQPEDLHTLKVSSGFFDVLLETQKRKILFPEVIKILAGKRANWPRSTYGVHGKVAKHFLNCRLVCRTWQIGVDTALQNFSHYNKLLDVTCHQNLSLSVLPKDAHFSLQEQLVAFLQQFDGKYTTKSRNPFIGRNLHIYLGNQITDLKSFTQHLLQMLAIFGHHIWSFSMFLLFLRQPFDASNVRLYEQLRDFLHLMPNLKVLKISCQGGRSNDNWKALGLGLESCVFPELKDLTYLQMETVPTPVFDALLLRYSHVNMLSSYTLFGSSDNVMYTHNLPNLTQIAVSLRDLNHLLQWDASNTSWPLKTLIIRLQIAQLHSDWQSLFQFLENRWASTLTELKIDYFRLPFPDNHSPEILPSLKLPNLKVFSFTSNILVLLDFTLPMRNSLERLVVRYYPEVTGAGLEPEFEKKVQFFKFRRNLKNANIWKLFPKLHTATYFDRELREQICHRPMSIF